MNYREADTKLYHKGHGGVMDDRKIANNTWLVRLFDGDIGMVYHRTRVVTFHKDGTVTLNTGGWYTYTTKERMNWVDGLSVYSHKGEWYVQVGGRRGVVHDFHDGMRIDLATGWLAETVAAYGGV